MRRERCASATICTMRASIVSRPTLTARMVRAPVWLSVPPVTGAPCVLATGMASPVIIDSSTDDRPSIDFAIDRHFLARPDAQAYRPPDD